MHEASTNTDQGTIRLLIQQVLSIFDDNFDSSHIEQLADIYESTPADEKEMVSLAVTYKNELQDLTYVVNNDSGSRDVHFFSENNELVNNIQAIFRSFSELPA